MENIVLLNMLVLGSIALVAAVILYVVSKKFAVRENPKIAEIEELLPQANCGGCGKAGCHDFADAQKLPAVFFVRRNDNSVTMLLSTAAKDLIGE